MQKSLSLNQVSNTEETSNVSKRPYKNNSPGKISKRSRRYGEIFEQYCITIKPKLHRSSSLSDLNTVTSDFTLNYLEANHLDPEATTREAFYGSSGDAGVNCQEVLEESFMSWNLKGRRSKKKGMFPETYTTKYACECAANLRREIDPNISSSVDSSSVCSAEQENSQRGASFPFKSTPSGNLKVQSNQVVFQSSTVGVLLADPTQAKVKVKFEGKAAGEPDDESSQNFENEPDIQPRIRPRENKNILVGNISEHLEKLQHLCTKEDRSIDLASLGYTTLEPVDWMRVQLPKKQDLFQEFYRRIHNFVNTDTIVRIGDDEFHCHHMVLQIYSSFFNTNISRDVELPASQVTSEAFKKIYEWMILNGAESNKVLKRNNILDIFCAAQYLSIKDLEDQCWAFIVNESLFSEDTAFVLFREAKSKGLTPVVDIMVPRVKRFFLPLVASKDFLSLDAKEVMTFLKSDHICVTSEIEVLMAGVRWMHGDWSSRCRYAVDIMRCIRFGLISPWQLVDIKRNPDNAEVLQIVNDPEVQKMVDDGLAYVIIKYWYGNNSKNYYHWIDVLGLTEPAERNWIGEEKNHVTYKDFLKYLEQFAVPKDQMYQQMAMMQPLRRNEDLPGGLRGMDSDKMEMRRPKMEFPLPATLRRLSCDNNKSFPTMSEFFDNRRKSKEGNQSPSFVRSPGEQETPILRDRRGPVLEKHQQQKEQKKQPDLHKDRVSPNRGVAKVQQKVFAPAQYQNLNVESLKVSEGMNELPEKESTLNTTNSESSSGTTNTSSVIEKYDENRRHSVAASYLAAATAALASTTRQSQNISPARARISNALHFETSQRPIGQASLNSNTETPQISLFNHSKESLARINMNKLSNSILGPSNKKYNSDGSLFNWDRETVLVFGGTDPHTRFGVGKNTGKEIYRYDPVLNVWENVGDLPEPRHHHSVAFLRGRVYLVGGADPRDDDLRGKSVVVSTVWSFEPVSRSWYSENGLIVPRQNFGLVVHKMALYAIGGQDIKGKVLRSVERFDPRTRTWSEVRSMSVARSAMACTKYREYIWVAGGMTGEKKRPVCKIVECYNSRTDEWTEIHSLRFPRCFATLFSMNDNLYIIGGAGKVSEKEKTASSISAIDIWDWKDRQWKLQTEMSMPRHGHALAYLGTQLIIIGGVTTIYMRALNNVESYCCERGAWIRGVAALPSPLSGHGAITLPPASIM